MVFKNIFCAFLLLFSLLPGKVLANHLRGFEMSWKCIGVGSDSGKIVFEVKGYRDCSGSILPSLVQMTNPLYSNYGGPVVINMGLLPGSLGRRDLSPTCYDTSLQKDCYNSAENSGIYEQFYYRSSPVTLQGVPDSNGSTFYFTSCCAPSLTNIASGGSYFFKVVMFPHINPNSGKPDTLGTASGPTCYDSSPRYAEDVPFLGFIGVTNYQSNQCIDVDGDALVYSFDSVPTTLNQYYQYAPGYSGANPFPNTYHYAANIPLSLDPNTSNFTFKPYAPTGEFLIGHKTTSYRNGQRIAEVFRTYVMILDSLPSDKYNRMNKPPEISFKNNSAATYANSYADTFAVGDILHINVKAEDYDSLKPHALQSVSLRMIPQNHQEDPTNPNNCTYTHCAYLDTNNIAWKDSIFEDTSIVVADLLWTLDCELLGSLNPSSITGSYKTYYFSFIARDNICPFPLNTIANISVTIKDSSDSQNRIRRIEARGDSNLVSWPYYLGTSPFSFYKVYRTNILNGIFTLLHTENNIADTSYLDTSARATQQPYFYKIETASISCNPNLNVVRSLHLDVSINGKSPKLDWNDLTYFQAVLNTGTYEIFSDTGNGWQSRVIIPFGQDSWTDSLVSCKTTAKYRIDAYDQTNKVELISNIDSVYVGYKKTVEYEICQGDSILLSGAWRFTAGIYPDTVPAGGCDTLIDRELIVHPTRSVGDTIRICDGDSTKIAGIWQSQPGVYPKMFQTTFGCDSVVNYQLLLKPVYEDRLEEEICEGDSVFDPVFVMYFYNPGEYIKYAYGRNGCDSNHVLSLTWKSVNVSLTRSFNTLTAVQTGATYRWFDCDTGEPIPNSNSRSFTPTQNGTYAASITYNGCTDTTQCEEITGVGIENYTNGGISIFPNPVLSYLYVNHDPEFIIRQIDLKDIHGKKIPVDYKTQSSSSLTINLNSLKPGVYFIRFTGNRENEVFRFIKE